jgi:AcrR family transcriptional regulator
MNAKKSVADLAKRIQPEEVSAALSKTTRRSPKGERTRAKIVDTAERLFGLKSYETVSQRDVADEAGILIGLVTHHYPNKVSLFDAVISRRAEDLSRRRLHRLEKADKSSVEEIIDAFFCPLMDLIKSGSDGWDNYARLMSKMMYSEVGAQSSRKYHSATVKIFLEALSSALPMIDRMTVTHVFIYSIETLLTALYMPDRMAGFADVDETADQDAHQVYMTIRPFVLGGIDALTKTKS